MLPISAADSVSPAIQRTRDLLFRPFRWGTYLKLGLVAIITEGVGSNLHSSSHGGPSSGHGSIAGVPFTFTPEWIAAIAAAVLVAIVLSIVIFYLVTRLRFAFFHCLIHATKEIRPGWRLYRAQAMRFFWLNIGVGFCFLLLVALAALPFVAGFVRLFREMQPGGKPDLGLLLSLVLPLIPVILLLVLVGVVVDVILRDWMLPHYALEDATAGEAWEEVWDRITAEKRQFAVYALLRLILPAIAKIGVVHRAADSGAHAGRIGCRDRVRHSLGLRGRHRRLCDRRHHPRSLLRSACIRLRAVGQHLPRRAREHGGAGVCADLLRRPLPGAGRHPLPAANASCLRGHHKSLGDSRQPLLGNQRQQLEGCALRAFFAALPLAHKAGRHVQIARKDCLAGSLAQAKRANLVGSERLNRRQAKLVELAHRPLVHHPGGMKTLGSLVNRCHQVATILLRCSHS